MDRGKFQKLNPYHVIFLVQNAMISIGLLSLPHFYSPMGYDQWIMPLATTLLVQVLLCIYCWLALKHPTKNWFELNTFLLGKWIGKVINLYLVLYAILIVATITEGYMRLIQSITLPERTITVPLIFYFGVLLYLISGGIKSIARFCIISFVATAWMTYYLQWSFSKGSMGNLLPLANFMWNEFYTSFHQGFFAFLGFELILVFFPYILSQKDAWKHASYGLWITTFFYTLVCLASIAYFSEWQLARLLFPVLNLYKAVELSFIERIENLGITVWIFLILSSTAAYLWMAIKGVQQVFQTERSWTIAVCAGLAFFLCLSYLPQDFKNMLFRTVITYAGYFTLLLPLLLIPIHWLRRRRNTV